MNSEIEKYLRNLRGDDDDDDKPIGILQSCQVIDLMNTIPEFHMKIVSLFQRLNQIDMLYRTSMPYSEYQEVRAIIESYSFHSTIELNMIWIPNNPDIIEFCGIPLPKRDFKHPW